MSHQEFPTIKWCGVLSDGYQTWMASGIDQLGRDIAAEAAFKGYETLQGLILEGEHNFPCLTFARQQWGVSRAQGYRLLKRSWTQSKADVEKTGINRQELLEWSIQIIFMHRQKKTPPKAGFLDFFWGVLPSFHSVKKPSSHIYFASQLAQCQ